MPEASIVFDRFHVTKVINEAVDKIRKEDVKDNPLLKGSKYLFLSQPKKLSKKQKARLKAISLTGLNLKTMPACHIKEGFRQIYVAKDARMFERLLKSWSLWLTHNKLPHMIKAAKTIKRHWDGIMSWANKNISNDILEGFNSIFQAAKSKTRGFRLFSTIKAIIYLLTGKLDLSKINPY